MKFATNITQSRSNILTSGIQQTNRYRLFYPQFSKEYLYPYNITLPGLGYDFIDHSIWSIPRKIPFRKTFTDLEVTFIVGNSNYKTSISWWNGAITNPKGSSQNGIGFFEEREKPDIKTVLGNAGLSPSAAEGGAEQNESPAIDQLQGAIDDVNKFVEDNFTGVTDNVKGDIYGFGGAANYMDDIYSNKLIIDLLDASDSSKVITSFTFNEVYISQIAQVNLTSTETGYSPFKIFFKFAQVSAK